MWIDCEELDGYGRVSVDGGSSLTGGGGGGGAGGRISVNYQKMVNFNGTMSAVGGNYVHCISFYGLYTNQKMQVHFKFISIQCNLVNFNPIQFNFSHPQRN